MFKKYKIIIIRRHNKYNKNFKTYQTRKNHTNSKAIKKLNVKYLIIYKFQVTFTIRIK